MLILWRESRTPTEFSCMRVLVRSHMNHVDITILHFIKFIKGNETLIFGFRRVNDLHQVQQTVNSSILKHQSIRKKSVLLQSKWLSSKIFSAETIWTTFLLKNKTITNNVNQAHIPFQELILKPKPWIYSRAQQCSP